MRIYGHIGWIDTTTGKFEDGRSLCGQRVSRKRTAPLITCRTCVAELVRQASPTRMTYRYFGGGPS